MPSTVPNVESPASRSAQQPSPARRGWLQVARSARAAQALESRVRSLQAQGVDARRLDRDERLVIATNAYTDGLWPGLGRTVLPVNSYVIATPPLAGAAAHAVLPGAETVATTDRLLLYFRRDREGRLVVGGRGSFGTAQGWSDFAHLARAAQRLFPQLGAPRLSHAWSGQAAITQDGLPHVHEPAPGVTLALGYNGRGIAAATSLGRHLVRRLLSAPRSGLRPARPPRGFKVPGKAGSP